MGILEGISIILTFFGVLIGGVFYRDRRIATIGVIMFLIGLLGIYFFSK